MSENEALIRRFFARWGESFDEFCNSFRDAFSERCLFQQTGIADLLGAEQAVALMTHLRASISLETVQVEIRTVVSEGRLLACERIDRLKNAQGTLIATIPCTGFMEIEQGKIVTWRDYFDSATLPEVPV